MLTRLINYINLQATTQQIFRPSLFFIIAFSENRKSQKKSSARNLYVTYKSRHIHFFQQSAVMPEMIPSIAAALHVNQTSRVLRSIVSPNLAILFPLASDPPLRCAAPVAFGWCGWMSVFQVLHLEDDDGL